MAGRGRSGRFASGGRGRGISFRVVGDGDVNIASGVRDVCACEDNAPLLDELRKLDGECLRQGKQNLRHGVLRAIKSVKRYPLPITTEAEACNLEGVGSFTARRMLKGLPPAAAATTASAAAASRAPATSARRRMAPPPTATTGGAASSGRANDEENIEPWPSSSSLDSDLRSSQPGMRPTGPGPGSACSFIAARDRGISLLRPGGASAQSGATRPALSLAANVSALRREDETGTLDVTPRRPTSRARREEEGDGGVGKALSSEGPSSFSGSWEAWLIVDNREHECMSVQSALLQKGVRCETRQLPLGDMLWVAKRKDAPAPEVLLGYIVERKTAPDLASSIVDGRYDEQKRRLKLSGLRQRIYLVEGNLAHQNQLAPAALRAALATSQACSGLAVVRCASLRDTVDFLVRTHRHVASLLRSACSASDKRWPENSSGGCGGVKAQLHPAMTYDEYTRSCAKRSGSTTARKLLGAMVRQAPGCSAARAEAIVRAFESPLGLMLAFEHAAAGGKEGEPLDDGAERFRRVEELLGRLRCAGGAGTNKLPQPLRRLLCRLFLEDSLDAGDVDGVREAGDGGGDMEEALGCGWGVEPMSQGDGY